MEMSEDSIIFCRTIGKKSLQCRSSIQPNTGWKEDKGSTLRGVGFFGQIRSVPQPYWMSPSLQVTHSITRVYNGHLWWTVVLSLNLMRSVGLFC